MKLYKYVSASTAVKIIDSVCIRFSTLASFNDPFEGQVHEVANGFGKKEMINELANQFLEMQANGERLSLENLDPNKPIQGLVALYQNGKLSGISEDIQFVDYLTSYLEARELSIETGPSDWTVVIHNRVAKELRASCFSRNPSNSLMWAHYAEDHKGVLLEFETSNCCSFLDRAEPVSYCHAFPEYSSIQNLARSNLGRKQSQPSNERTFLQRFAFTKSTDWEYEAEWRVLAKAIEFKESNGFVPFPRELLTKVIFGCRCSAKTVDSIQNSLSNNFGEVQLQKALRSRTSFQLEYKDM